MSLTLSPSAVGDVARWSVAKDPVAAMDLGMAADGHARVYVDSQVQNCLVQTTTDFGYPSVATYDGATSDIWYPVPMANGAAALVAIALVNSRHHTWQLQVAKKRTIEAVAINVTAGVAGSAARLALYANTAGTGYPAALLVDFGELNLATNGIKSITGLSTQLVPGTFYWFDVWNTGTSTCRGPQLGASLPIPLGFENTLGTAPAVCWNVTEAFVSGTPAVNPYTAGGVRQMTTSGAVTAFIRYSA